MSGLAALGHRRDRLQFRLGGSARLGVGTWHDGRRNEWRRVDFTGADLRVAACQSALYEDCDFSSANLTNVTFGQCALVRCTFSGRMRDVVFDGRELPGNSPPQPLVEVDFGRAVFEDVELLGYVLDRVVLPRDPDVRVIRGYRSVVERALAQLGDDESLPARMLRAEFSNWLHMARAATEDSVFNRRDYLASGGEELADLAAVVLGPIEEGQRS